MNNHMRTHMTHLSVATLLLAAACASESNQTQPVTTTTDTGASTAPPTKEVGQRRNALARFIHAAPGLAAVDEFANDTKVTAETRYKAVTPYAEISADNPIFRLRLTGQEGTEPLTEEKKGFSAGSHYTVIAIPSNATAIFSKDTGQRAEPSFISDELIAPASGKAKVHVIDPSPDLGEVDIYVTGRAEALSKGVKFASETDGAGVEPVGGTIEVRRAGENAAPMNVPDVRLEAGKLYTIIVVGRTKGVAKLESIIVEDQFGAATPKTE